MRDFQTKRAKLAYEAYCEAVGGKSWDGKPLQKWDDLPESIQLAWAVAAKAVADFTKQAMQHSFDEAVLAAIDRNSVAIKELL